MNAVEMNQTMVDECASKHPHLSTELNSALSSWLARNKDTIDANDKEWAKIESAGKDTLPHKSDIEFYKKEMISNVTLKARDDYKTVSYLRIFEGSPDRCCASGTTLECLN